MQHPFAVLAPEYSGLLAAMKITRDTEARQVASRLLGGEHYFDEVSAWTGVPKLWAMASFEREAGSNFRLSPAQGDPWNSKSIHVPKNRGPFDSWPSAAEDAYHLDGLDQVGAANWFWTRACYEGELFNGFGYRARGIHSPYLLAGTNLYTRGKFTADGHFDPSVVDQQLGIIPVMVMMQAMKPSLALADDLGKYRAGAPPAAVPAPLPAPAGHGADNDNHDVAWLQAALNKLESAELVVDDSYGRNTRRAVIAFQKSHGLAVDGIAGRNTFDAIRKALAA
jgi:lysozyme family protein